jgi:hypothetical protein
MRLEKLRPLVAAGVHDKDPSLLKGAVWGLSAQRDHASAEYDVASVLFDVTMQNLHVKKLTLSLSQRNDTWFFFFSLYVPPLI